MQYEELVNECYGLGLEVCERKQKSKGVYHNGIIGISSQLETSIDKLCVLAEEIGHYETTIGNILDQKKVTNRKQEKKARAWSYEKLLPIDQLISAFTSACNNSSEIAEFAEITEEFLIESLTYYKGKYGLYKVHGDYIIFFEPLGVMMKLE